MIYVGILSLKTSFCNANQGGKSHLHSYYNTSEDVY